MKIEGVLKTGHLEYPDPIATTSVESGIRKTARVVTVCPFLESGIGYEEARGWRR